MVYNYVRAFTDYIINFTFARGVHFRSPKLTEAIVPGILKRVWEVDNDKDQLLWEVGQQGGVSGDAFIKVAYEDPWEDGAGNMHPGRVRVLPLNAAHSFPEFHPHDRQRLLRFKLKYRFWGTSLEGTRQVYTYTEIMTDNVIEEYINDELIDSRPNPLGIIPVVHIPNTRVSGSPWGLSDCHDVIGLNRNFNEVATDIADIINYHAAPVTVIVGAKTSQLEKGPRKVWGGLPKDAKVFNLEGGAQGLDSGLKYLELLKLSMHEMVGIPETALGQMQPISNTSGVALSIQFQPLMNRWYQKTVLYREGMERVNEVILRYIAWKEPWALEWNESYGVPPKPGQLAVLDPQDPATYRSIVHFMNPLPLDKLIALNEIQAKIAMGLESKEGALRALGEEFPAQKLHEIQEELLEDARGDGVLLMVKAQVAQAIQGITGFIVSGGDVLPDPNPPLDANGNPVPTGSPVDDPVIADIGSQLLTEAYGTKEAQYRNPDNQAGAK